MSYRMSYRNCVILTSVKRGMSCNKNLIQDNLIGLASICIIREGGSVDNLGIPFKMLSFAHQASNDANEVSK